MSWFQEFMNIEISAIYKAKEIEGALTSKLAY